MKWIWSQLQNLWQAFIGLFTAEKKPPQGGKPPMPVIDLTLEIDYGESNS